MSKDIDKLFKDQLSNRSFEWKESHWEAAEAVIIAAEKKKRKRRFFFFFWLTGGVALASALTLGFWKDRPSFELGSFPVEVLPERLERERTGGPLAEAGSVRALSNIRQVAADFPSRSNFRYLTKAVSGQIPDAAHSAPVQENAESFRYEASLSFIPGLAFFAKGGGVPQWSVAVPAERATEPVDRSFRWSAGIAAGGRLDADVLPGAWMGVMFSGPLAGKWAWSAGLHYAVQRIPEAETGRSAQIDMAFGAAKTQYVSTLLAVHQLEVPLGLQYRLGRSVWMEAGIMPSFRVGGYGNIRQLTYPMPWERTGEEQANYQTRLAGYYIDLAAGGEPDFPEMERGEVLESGWLTLGKEDAFQASAFAGAQVMLGERISLMGRLGYRVTISAEANAMPLSLSLGVAYWLR